MDKEELEFYCFTSKLTAQRYIAVARSKKYKRLAHNFNRSFDKAHSGKCSERKRSRMVTWAVKRSRFLKKVT